MNARDVLMALLWCLPLGLGAAVFFSKSVAAADRIEKFNRWLDENASLHEKHGGLKGFWLAPFLWMMQKSKAVTNKVADRFLRIGLQIALTLYAIECFVALAVLVVYMALVLVVGYFIFKLIGGSVSEKSENSLPQQSPGAAFGVGGDGRSYRRERLLGDGYVEHLDDYGTLIGRSESKYHACQGHRRQRGFRQACKDCRNVRKLFGASLRFSAGSGRS